MLLEIHKPVRTKNRSKDNGAKFGIETQKDV